MLVSTIIFYVFAILFGIFALKLQNDNAKLQSKLFDLKFQIRRAITNEAIAVKMLNDAKTKLAKIEEIL